MVLFRFPNFFKSSMAVYPVLTMLRTCANVASSSNFGVCWFFFFPYFFFLFFFLIFFLIFFSSQFAQCFQTLTFCSSFYYYSFRHWQQWRNRSDWILFSSHEFDLHKTAANLPRTEILKYLLSLSHVVDKHIRSIAVLGDTKHERFS